MSKASSAERRVSLRFPCIRVSPCLVQAAYDRLWVRVQDISARGMALIVNRPFRPETSLVIQLTRADYPLALPARVVHCTPHDHLNWKIGCEFDTPLVAEELNAFLEGTARPACADASRVGFK